MTCLMSRLKVVLLDVSSISGRYKHEVIYGAEGIKYHRLALILNHFFGILWNIKTGLFW